MSEERKTIPIIPLDKNGAIIDYGGDSPDFKSYFYLPEGVKVEEFTIYEVVEEEPYKYIKKPKTVNVVTFYCHSEEKDDDFSINTNGDGTKQNPWKDLQHALNEVICLLDQCINVQIKLDGVVNYNVSRNLWFTRAYCIIDGQGKCVFCDRLNDYATVLCELSHLYITDCIIENCDMHVDTAHNCKVHFNYIKGNAVTGSWTCNTAIDCIVDNSYDGVPADIYCPIAFWGTSTLYNCSCEGCFEGIVSGLSSKNFLKIIGCNFNIRSSILSYANALIEGTRGNIIIDTSIRFTSTHNSYYNYCGIGGVYRPDYGGSILTPLRDSYFDNVNIEFNVYKDHSIWYGFFCRDSIIKNCNVVYNKLGENTGTYSGLCGFLKDTNILYNCTSNDFGKVPTCN